uniref:adenylate cyclase n=1 Tax=Trypanosoma congolense (strain IL3000) TaxID=1068625 RepID=G0UZ03_TRYCI|nr:unnamed protein product [Trypanosoma congolense IL3000]
MDTYLKTNEDWGVFGKPEHFDDNHHNGELMVIGWLTAEVITRALIDSISLKKQTTFIESLYNQRRYLVDDIVIGDFGGNCTQGVAQQGATCQCNQGGSVVYMKEVVDGYRLEPLKEGFLTWGVAKCSSEDIRVHPPLSSLVLLMRDNDLANPVSQQYFTGISSLLGSERELEDERLFIRTINTTDAGASADMEGTRNDLVVSSILAVVNHDVLKIEGLVFVDPILTTPRLGKFRRNVIHIFPTLPQELYVIAQYLSKEAMGSVNVIIRSDEAADISALVSRTLLTFGVPLGSTFLMDINSTIPATYHKLKGDAIFIGLLPSDLNVVMDHLGKSPHARVFIAFTDVMFLYEGLRDAFQDERRKNLAERLVFATSLHHWGDKNTRSGNIAAYQKAVNDENLWSPVSLRGFLAAQFLETVISPMKKVNAELLSEEIFWQNSFVVEDMRYGPFNDESCAVDGLVISSNCARNYGATDISLWSFLRVLDPSVPVLQGAMTPSMEYKVISMQLTTEQTIGIAFGAVAAVLLLVVLGVSLVCTMRNSRDNDKAPKEATDPVTILFTDIESSTAQWAAYPEIMTEAVAMHHRTIRSLIRKHNCYEVKTIGDSFMIAGKSPSEAVQLAHDLQQAFFKCNWKTTQVDEFYRQCEEQRKVEGAVEGYEPPTARLDPDVYRELWNGLRVRVGIHTGLCDIRHDKVTKGYDYYGQTTNMAARTESVANGGQVLLTGATYLALTMEERRCLDVKPLGPVPLRGVPEPVEMYQLEAVPGRKFPALCPGPRVLL